MAASNEWYNRQATRIEGALVARSPFPWWEVRRRIMRHELYDGDRFTITGGMTLHRSRYDEHLHIRWAVVVPFRLIFQDGPERPTWWEEEPEPRLNEDTLNIILLDAARYFADHLIRPRAETLRGHEIEGKLLPSPNWLRE